MAAPQYIVDSNGQKISVVLSVADYNRLTKNILHENQETKVDKIMSLRGKMQPQTEEEVERSFQELRNSWG